MTIKSVDAIFNILNQLGFHKQRQHFGWLYSLDPSYGSGYIRLIGHTDKYYLVEAEFEFKNRVNCQLDIAIEEPFVELSYVAVPFEISVKQKELKTIQLSQLSCHINHQMPNYEIVFPEKTPIAYRNIIIRSAYIQSFFPEFYVRYRHKFKQLETIRFAHPKIISIFDRLFDKTYWQLAEQVFLNSKVLEILSFLITYLDGVDKTKKKLSQYNVNAIEFAKVIVDKNYQHPLSLHELSKRVGVNLTLLKSGFKQQYGITIFQYIRYLRMQQSIELLKNTTLNIDVIANRVGYASTTHFYKNFKLEYGLTPKQYRDNLE